MSINVDDLQPSWEKKFRPCTCNQHMENLTSPEEDFLEFPRPRGCILPTFLSPLALVGALH